MKSALGVALFWLSISSIALARIPAAEAQQCKSEKNSEVIFGFTSSSDSLDCKDKDAIESLMADIARSAPIRPPKVYVDVFRSDNSDLSGFNFDQLTILFGFPTDAANWWRPVMVHEYGHLILFSVLKEDFVELRDGTDVLTSTYGVGSYPSRNDYTLRIEEDKLIDINSAAGSLDELFADLYAAIYFANPDVISNAIKDPNRSFNNKAVADCNIHEKHCSLDSVRNAIWSQWVLPRIRQRDLLRQLTSHFRRLVVEAVNNKRDDHNSTEHIKAIQRELGIK